MGTLSEAPEPHLALHVAAAGAADGAELRRLAAASPDAVRCEDTLGRIALHWACHRTSPGDAVAALLAAYPEGARVRAAGGVLPLHAAAEASGASDADAASFIDVVAALLSAAPETAASPDRLGRLPLHCAAAAGAPLGVVRALLAAHRRGAGEADGAGQTPAHAAAGAGARAADVLALLLDVHPQAARAADGGGRLPLHAAAAAAAPPEVLRAILRHNPDAAGVASGTGQTPLHCCAGAGERCCAECIATLLEAHPAAASAADATGYTPLHCAARSRAPLAAVASLLAASPESASARSANGATPLHVAAACGAPLEVLTHLLAAFPEAAKLPDADGLLPLHCAAETKASGTVVAALLAAHPGGASAVARGLRPLAAWLAACSAAGTLADEAPWLATPLRADAALAAMAVHELCRHPEAAGALAAAVDAHPTLPNTPEPAAAPGKRLSALDAAAPACRAAMLKAGWLLRRYSLASPPFRTTPRSELRCSEDGGVDAGNFHRKVVLKFVRRRDAFERERDRRAELLRCDAASSEYVLPLLAAHAGAGPSADSLYAEEAALRGLHLQLLVLPRADADLGAALASRPDARAGPAGRDWRAARHTARQLAACLAHLHAAGCVHGAFSTRAAVRCGDSLGGKWKLVDLDGVVSFARGEYISDHVAPACAPPELCARGEGEPGVWLRCVPERGVLEAWGPGSLKADVSYDMWSYGAVLYHIVTGAPLWPDADAEDALPQPTLERLADWDSAALEAALAPLLLAPQGAPAATSAPAAEPAVPGTPGGRRDAVSAAAAASLLRMLLHPTPAMRPSAMDAVLDHPFLNPAGGCFHSERGALPTEAEAPGSPGGGPRRGAVDTLAESLLSAVAGFNFSLLAGGVTGAATAPTAPPSISALPAAAASATSSGGASGIGAAIVAAISGSPRKTAPPVAMGPPPAVVGPFPKTGLPRFGAYPAAAAAAAADRAPPSSGAEGVAAASAMLDADSPRFAAAASATAGGAFAWAEPLPATRAGTVAPTRSLVGVPAIPGGVRSAPSSPPRKQPTSPSPLGRIRTEREAPSHMSLAPAAATTPQTAPAGGATADGFAVVEL